MSKLPEVILRRRAFLSWCTGLGVGGTLFPGALWAQTNQGQGEITENMIRDAARLAGLEFTDSNIAQMLEGVRTNLSIFADIRGLDIDQSVPPPLYFNPVVPGQQLAGGQSTFASSTRPQVRRPENLQDMAFWPLADIAQMVKSQQVTSVELTQMFLSRIERFDPLLRSVITLTEELAMRQATRADTEIAAGRYRGPLHGIPWGAKDLLAARGYRTTWGFAAYRDQVIDMDATVVQRLARAGAVLIAKLSSGEIARGDSWLGIQTRNPWKTDEGSGGSSAGPAAATAAGLVAFSIGTDTTGSILGPSRTCGITGLRPTFGRVSRHGVMPVCWSLDKVGPMCRTAEDCALVFNEIFGPDGEDLAVVDRPFSWNGDAGPENLRVGYVRSAFEREADADERASLSNDHATLEALRELGIELTGFEVPEHADMDVLQMLLVDEAAAFDELVQNGKIDLFRQDIEETEDMLMRIARLYPAVEYLQTNRRRMLLMRNMANAFGEIDVLVTPFSGSPMQSATSMTGHPAVAVQNGFDRNGKPTGIQFIGKLYGESQALKVAQAYQDATDFHQKHPPLFQ